eukprot:5904749-Amphidinium_carterae.1
MGSQAERCFRVHHSSDGSLRYFLRLRLTQSDPRFGVRSFTQLGPYQSPKVKDLGGKAGPTQPRLFRVQSSMSSCASVWLRCQLDHYRADPQR